MMNPMMQHQMMMQQQMVMHQQMMMRQQMMGVWPGQPIMGGYMQPQMMGGYPQQQMMAGWQGYPQQQVAGPAAGLLGAGAGSTPAADALPAGWVAAKDPASGKEYYYHAATSKTTWEKPAAPAAAAPATPALQRYSRMR